MKYRCIHTRDDIIEKKKERKKRGKPGRGGWDLLATGVGGTGWDGLKSPNRG